MNYSFSPNCLIPMSLISVMIKNNFSRNRANFDRFTNIDLKNLAFDQISRTWYYISPSIVIILTVKVKQISTWQDLKFAYNIYLRLDKPFLINIDEDKQQYI